MRYNILNKRRKSPVKRYTYIIPELQKECGVKLNITSILILHKMVQRKVMKIDTRDCVDFFIRLHV